MKLEDHVLRAIDAFERNSKDEALMHATIGIDSTAKNLYSVNNSAKKRYKDCLRKYWWIIERFVGEGLNLEETKFTNLKLDDGHGKIIVDPDLADIIYHIFRCNHVHGQEVPMIFQLLPYQDGYYTWHIDRINNSVKMPETIIWALLAVCVFCRANSHLKTQGDYELKWGNQQIGITSFPIKEYWGREDDLKSFFARYPTIRVKLDKL